MGQGKQTERLRQGVDILIATPGRLLDLMGQGYISLADIEIFVLDEADRMLDMGFIHDVKKLLKVIPVKRQTLFFSATMAPEIMTLARSILRNPEKVEITPISTTAETIKQHVYHVDKINKNPPMVHILKEEKIKNVLVFTEISLRITDNEPLRISRNKLLEFWSRQISPLVGSISMHSSI